MKLHRLTQTVVTTKMRMSFERICKTILKFLFKPNTIHTVERGECTFESVLQHLLGPCENLIMCVSDVLVRISSPENG